jgi:hypothetical protein
MTFVRYRKEAAARSESGNAKDLKRFEQDVSVGPADIRFAAHRFGGREFGFGHPQG